MEVQLNEVLAMVGEQTVEIRMLRAELAAAQAKIAALEKNLATNSKKTPEEVPTEVKR
jgi:hypothetical protein|tara:strand:+ start:392 stop:565 length:174 start_codon:yes stop_codon:yes gene_type:complete